MKSHKIILILLLFFAAAISAFKINLNQRGSMVDDMTKIFDIIWYHSYEEDQGDLKAYRPDGFEFPPARGRAGMAFHDEGLFTKYLIGPTDKRVKVPGEWSKLAKKTYKITFSEQKKKDHHLSDLQIEVIELSKDKLVLRMTNLD
jgi:hypothetical protein